MTDLKVNSQHPYLDELDATPIAQQWDKVRGWLAGDDLAFFKELREYRPILQLKECVLVARYDDVTEALNQPKIFTVELYRPKMGKYLMTEDETPLHNREKSIMLSLLRQEDVACIRQFVQSACDEALDNAAGEIDIVNDYGRLIPARMVQHVFGLNLVSPRTLIGWSYWNQFNAFRNQHFHEGGDSLSVHLKMQFANVKLLLYMGSLLLLKRWHIFRGKPQNDTVTRMLTEHSFFAAQFHFIRQALNGGGLLIGAVETSSEATAHIMQQLVKRPDMLAKAVELASEGETDAFDRMCWEALRFRPIAPYIFRKLSTDYTFYADSDEATKLSKGSTVLNLISSAMFDESAFDRPGDFDPTREFGKSFHFGFGSHECMGKIVGMQMIPEMVRQLLRRSNLQMASNIEYLGKPFPERFMFKWDL